MLDKRIHRKNNSLYNSTAFYKSTSYLQKGGIIKKVKGKREVEIKLTLKGEFLGEILASLPDVNKEIRNKHGLE